jgi:glycerol-3-phosphate acyltransferase PlsY
MLVLSWICVAIWCTIWLVLYLYVKNVHASNISASVLSPAAAWLMPPSLQPAPAGSGNTFAAAVLVLSVLCVMILQRHIEYMPELRRFIHKPKRSE